MPSNKLCQLIEAIIHFISRYTFGIRIVKQQQQQQLLQTKPRVYIGSRERDEQWSLVITTSHLFLTANDFKILLHNNSNSRKKRKKPTPHHENAIRLVAEFISDSQWTRSMGRHPADAKPYETGKCVLSWLCVCAFSPSPPSSSLSSSPSWSYYKQQTNCLPRYESSVWRGGQIEPHCLFMQRRRITMSARAHAT